MARPRRISDIRFQCAVYKSIYLLTYFPKYDSGYDTDDEVRNEQYLTSLAASMNWKINPPTIVYPTSRIVSPIVEKRNATKLLRQLMQRRTRFSRCSPSCVLCDDTGVPTTACLRVLHRRFLLASAAAASISTAKLSPAFLNCFVFTSVEVSVLQKPSSVRLPSNVE